MKQLTRSQLKNINGGVYVDPGDGAKVCTSDSDCGTKDFSCSSGTVTSNGKCYLNPGATDKTCHWAGCPA